MKSKSIPKGKLSQPNTKKTPNQRNTAKSNKPKIIVSNIEFSSLPPELKDAANFLMRFGYIQSGIKPDEAEVERGLMQYQVSHNLPINGKLDDATFALIRAPRCGLPDNPQDYKQVDALITGKKRIKRDTIDSKSAMSDESQLPIRPVPHRWWPGVTRLTYFIDTASSGMDVIQVHDACKAAFDAWSNALNPSLTFVEMLSAVGADIHVAWLSGDPHPFMLNAIAHSDFPPRNPLPGPYLKPVHFDKDQSWTVQIPIGNAHDVQTIALHEIGHLVGFEHATNEPDSVMYDVFNFSRYQHALSMNDINSVRAGYGLP